MARWVSEIVQIRWLLLFFSGLSQQKTQTFLVAEKETGSPGEEDDGRAGEKRRIIIAPCVWFYKVVFGGSRSCTRARVVILGIGLFWVLLHHCIYSSQAKLYRSIDDGARGRKRSLICI